MRILGERSLVSLLKLVINIAYFGSIALGAIVVLAIVLILVLRPANMSLGLPAQFDIDPSVYDVAPLEDDGREVVIEKAQGQVRITGVTPWQVFQGLALAALGLAVAAFALAQFRGIFRTLSAREPFVQANVRRIRVLGLLLMFGEVARAGVVWLSAFGVARAFTATGIRFRADFQPSTTMILAGALLLVLAEVFREAASMKRDLETAREIQFDLVPDEEFRQDAISVRSRMRPANTVGGDYYDIVPLGEGQVAVVQGDVAGKGIPAALLMAVLQGSLRTLLSAGFRGSRLVGALNDYLDANTPSNRMVTLFYGELDTRNGELSFVNAGHNLPFLIRRDGSLARPGSSSMVLGILPGKSFEESALRLEPGERLLLFTDGVSEAFDSRDVEYGDERVAGYLRSHGAATPESLVDGLARDVLDHCRPARPTDDMTLMLISRE